MSDWWQDFFTGPWLPFQRAHAASEDNSRIARDLARLLALTPGAAVLDAPCGTGRIAVELAALGYRVTGLDASPELLAEARAEADRRGVSARWVAGDLRDPPPAPVIAGEPGRFDAAICYWNSFGYFDDDGNLAHARAMHRALAPGGRLLIDTLSLETLAPAFQDRGWWREGPFTAVEERSYHPLTGRWRVEWTFYDDTGKLGVRESDVRIYSAAELAGLLDRAGFVDVAVYGSLAGVPFTLGAAQLVAVATRGP